MEDPRDMTPHLHLAELFHMAGLPERARMETEMVVRMLGSREMFNDLLDALTKKDRSSGLRPSQRIIMPLLRDAILEKAEDLKEWGGLLSERTRPI
jgi:hypothetical protein